MENTILTGDRLIGFRLAYLFHEPERGDIVIFKYPDDESQNFVKRVIGIIVMSFRFPTDMYMSMVNSLKRIIFGEPMNNDGEELTYVVPADSYFMLGDNRNNSRIQDTGPTHSCQRIRLLLRFLSDISMSEQNVLHFSFIK